MAACASVKKKGSTQQCTAKALAGHTLCGRHARSKTVTLWTDANKDNSARMCKAQALVRGWLVRSRLALAGPGVLRRKDLANDEDLETCETSDRVHPYDYFAFEEAGKVWWFQVGTLWRWVIRKQTPSNPYTKVPLTTDTRKRLRAIWAYNRRHKHPLPAESSDSMERMQHRWNVISQVLGDNGFGELHPNSFLNLTKRQYVSIFHMMDQDLEFTVPNRKLRSFAHRIALQAITMSHTTPAAPYILQSSYLLMVLLATAKEPYTVCFTLLSAMYRC